MVFAKAESPIPERFLLILYHGIVKIVKIVKEKNNRYAVRAICIHEIMRRAKLTPQHNNQKNTNSP